MTCDFHFGLLTFIEFDCFQLFLIIISFYFLFVHIGLRSLHYCELPTKRKTWSVHLLWLQNLGSSKRMVVFCCCQDQVQVFQHRPKCKLSCRVFVDFFQNFSVSFVSKCIFSILRGDICYRWVAYVERKYNNKNININNNINININSSSSSSSSSSSNNILRYLSVFWCKFYQLHCVGWLFGSVGTWTVYLQGAGLVHWQVLVLQALATWVVQAGHHILLLLAHLVDRFQRSHHAFQRHARSRLESRDWRRGNWNSEWRWWKPTWNARESWQLPLVWLQPLLKTSTSSENQTTKTHRRRRRCRRIQQLESELRHNKPINHPLTSHDHPPTTARPSQRRLDYVNNHIISKLTAIWLLVPHHLKADEFYENLTNCFAAINANYLLTI